jgi:hypothetical protein
MAGDISHLDSSVTSQWPKANLVDPVTRLWFPVYAIILEVVTTLLVRAVLRHLLPCATKSPSHQTKATDLFWIYLTN